MKIEMMSLMILVLNHVKICKLPETYQLPKWNIPQEAELATEDEDADIKPITACKLYKRRWVMLCLFIVYSFINVMQWIQYGIIADVIVGYYGVSYEASDWSSMVFLLLYIPFSLPGSYCLEKFDLRVAVLLGMFGTCIGAWIKVASVPQNRYWVVLAGQSFVAAAEVFILPIPPRLAAVWFGPNEESSACSLGVFGSQLGIAVGYVFAPMLVNNRMQTHEIEKKLFMMSVSVAVFCSVLLLVLLLFFQAAPPTPPSTTQLQIQNHQHKSTNFINSTKGIICNPPYILLLIAYGMNMGVYYAISMLLNQIILKYHPDAGAGTGIVGLIIIVSGMIGSITGGVVLDKFRTFRETSLALYALSLVGTIAFTFVIDKSIEFIYAVSAIIGFSMAGVLTTGLELGVELTYPQPEGTSGGILTTSSQVFGIIFTYLYSFLFSKFNDIWANLTMCLVLVVSTFLIVCIRFDLRRQRARRLAELYK